MSPSNHLARASLPGEVDHDLREPGKTKLARRGGCHVDNPAPHERPTICDRDRYRTSILLVRHKHACPQRESAMRSRKGCRVQSLTARSPDFDRVTCDEFGELR